MCNKLTFSFNIQISVNQDHDDKLGSNLPLNDEFVEEKDYSDQESDTSTEFVNDDNNDNSDYIYSSKSLSCDMYSVTFQTKLNEDTTPDIVSGLNEVKDNKQSLDGFCLFQTFFSKVNYFLECKF